ncbi:helix-turn-helix domain-containing protein [Paenibacillus wynnii]|uniref:Helix-turn-helix domain-containing protein n=1 Tax=Paenibacillus wynnii TaxID=268407 RepID=A0A098M3P4_9BACL|nr:helix-turn-helix domain-containing protein [Paenibacillus wynnii]KGE16646.1 hypothetical protein PWYN_18240 [Paenibacillus wynnii]
MDYKTVDLLEAIRADIKQELREELLAVLQPEIERQLYSNIFDISEACRYLKVSDKTVRRMIKEDGLPHFWQRGQIFFQQNSLNRWISKKEVVK